jgi:hypothetical protein
MSIILCMIGDVLSASNPLGMIAAAATVRSIGPSSSVTSATTFCTPATSVTSQT